MNDRETQSRRPQLACVEERRPATKLAQFSTLTGRQADLGAGDAPRDVSLDAGRAAATFALLPQRAWRGDREAEGTRLLSGRRTKSYRGFESRPLRNET